MRTGRNGLPHPCPRSAEVGVPSTEQHMSEDKRANTRRKVKSVERRGSVVPPPRLQPTIVVVISAIDAALPQMRLSDGTHGPRTIRRGLRVPGRGISPRPTLMVASQGVTHMFIYLFGITASGPPVCSLIYFFSLCPQVAFSSLAQCSFGAIRRLHLCLFNVTISHRPRYTIRFTL